MSEQELQLTTLSKTEAQALQGFIWQVDNWQNQHGEKANHIEIVYYPEDDGFEVANNEPNNGLLKRNRVTAFRAEILAWATNQIKQLQGYTSENTVTAFACVYKNGEYGVAVEIAKASDTAGDTVSETAE